MPDQLPWRALLKFETDDFSDDCKELGNLEKKLIRFDDVRKENWSTLRSVDAMKIVDPAQRIWFIEFCDLRGEIAHIKKMLRRCKNQDELLIELLSREFEEKALHSLLILLRCYNKINPDCVEYTIVICSKDQELQKDIYFIENFKKNYKKSLHEKIFNRIYPVITSKSKKNTCFRFAKSFLQLLNDS